jgi:hypothetical protein
MNFDPNEQMSVYLNLEGSDKKRGTLAGSGKERRTHFEYGGFSRSASSDLPILCEGRYWLGFSAARPGRRARWII